MDMNALKENGLSFDQIKSMPADERKAFIRQVIEERDSKTQAVLFDASRGRTISIFEMADEMGIDECVDFIDNLIENSECHAQTMTGEEMHQAIARMRAGIASPEEENLVRAVLNSMMDTNSHKFHEHLTEIIIDLVNFVQNDVGYQPTMSDMYGAISVLSIINMVLDSSCALHKHLHGGPEVVSEIGIQVGEDIYNAWKATLTEEPDPSVTLAGLLFLTLRVAKEAGYKFMPASDIAERIGYELGEEEGEDCHCDGCCGDECNCHHENENGSNENIAQPVIPFPSKNEDQNMRDTLKD